VLLLCTVGITQNLFSQEIANSVVYEENVDNSSNAIQLNNSSATLNSDSGFILNAGADVGILELQYPGTLNPFKTTYTRIDFDQTILDALLQGSLGELVGDIVESVVFGNHYLIIELKNNSSVIGTYRTDSFPIADDFRIVIDENGDFFAAITAPDSFNRIRIEDHTNALLGLGFENSTEVFYSLSELSEETDCYQPQFTSGDAGGLNLDALNLGNEGITNPEKAIDNNASSFSQLSLGTAGVISSVSQLFYLPNSTQATDQFTISLKTDGALVSADIASNIEIIAYNNNTEVYSTDASTLLDVDLLQVLVMKKLLNLQLNLE